MWDVVRMLLSEKKDKKWIKPTTHTHARAHTVIIFVNIILLFPAVILRKEQYISLRTALPSALWLAGDSLQAWGVWGDIDMRTDSVYHAPPPSNGKFPDLSECVYLCVFTPGFLSNLNWQEMKSTVICVKWDHVKWLEHQGWWDHSNIGLDNSIIPSSNSQLCFWSLCAVDLLFAPNTRLLSIKSLCIVL